MWHIYAIGDSAFLTQILNAVAMLTGTGDFITLVKIGFLVGAISLSFKAIFQIGKGIDFSQLFVSWIVFAMSFGPTTRVSIEDVYTSRVTVVDNVPIGVASVGAIISRIGFGITQLFEQSFSTPNMTEYGFASSLEALIRVRTALLNAQHYEAANQIAGGSLEQDWINYLKECTLIGIDLGQLSLEYIMHHPSAIDAVRFDSRIYGTELRVGGTSQLDCTDAYAQLKGITQSEFLPKLRILMNAKLNSQIGHDFDSVMRASLNHLGLSAISTQNYMAAAVLLPLYEKAVQGKYQDEQAFSSATMINQAILQRNTQWAAQEQLFNNIVRPMMTFFEGFIYAITPMMAFVIALGATGIAMVGKYLLLLLWIQLWMPLLAIINLYIHLSIQKKMAALSQYADFQAASFSGLQQLDGILQSWLATGGMLASSVPAIALMIVYGSSVTATHLAGRLQNSDTIDEKIVTPDISQVGAVTQTQPLYQTSELSGIAKTGSQQLMSQFSATQAVSNLSSSAKEQLTQATTQFSNQLSQSLSHGFGQSTTYETLSSIGQSMASSQSESSDLVSQLTEDYQQRFGFGEDKKEAIRGLVTGVLSGNLSVGQGNQILNSQGNGTGMSIFDLIGKTGKIAVGAKGGLTGQAETSDAVTQTNSADTFTSELRSLSSNHGMKQAFVQAMSKDLAQSTRTGISSLLNQQNTSMLAQSAAEVQSATSRFSQIEQTNLSMGVQKQTDGATLTKLAANNPHVLEYLNQYLTNHPEAAGRMRAQLPLYQSLLPDDNQAYVAAALEALSYGQSNNMAERDNDQQAALNAMGMITQTPISTIQPDRHGMRPAMSQNPIQSAVSSRLNQLTNKMGTAAELGQAFTHAKNAATKSDEQENNSLLAYQHEGMEQFNQEKQQAKAEFRAQPSQVWADRIMNTTPSSSKASQFFNAVDQLKKTGEKYISGGSYAINQLSDDYQYHHEQAKNDTQSRGFLHEGGAVVSSAWVGLQSATQAGMDMQNPLHAFVNAYQNAPQRKEDGINWGTQVEAIFSGMYGAATQNQLGNYLQRYSDNFKTAAYQEGIAMGLTPLQSEVFALAFNEGIYNRIFNSQDPQSWSSEIQAVRTQMIGSEQSTSPSAVMFIDKQIGQIMDASLSGSHARNELINLRAYNRATHLNEK